MALESLSSKITFLWSDPNILTQSSLKISARCRAELPVGEMTFGSVSGDSIRV